jgi:outer membrane receptor protein involved in Fe transport
MSKLIYSIALFLLISACSILQAQTISIQGKVTDATTGSMVDGASVVLRELKKETVTNHNGLFYFSGVRPGTYIISVSHVSYAKSEHTIQVSSNDSIQIQLDPMVYHTGEVVVQSTKGSVSAESQPVPTVTIDGVHYVNSSAPTVADALSREPGIALVRDGLWETLVSIRGMSRYNIVMMLDNTRIETANDHAAALSLINPFDIDRVEVIKGANSALAGTGAFGGVVNVITKSPSFSDQRYVSGEVMSRYESVNNSYAEYAAAESGSDVYRFRASGVFRKADNYKSPAGEVPNSDFADWGFTADASVRLFNTQSLDVTYQRYQTDDAGIPGGSSLFPANATVRYTLARRELFKAEYSIPELSEVLPMLVVRASQQNITRNVLLVPVVGSPASKTPHAEHQTGTVQIELTIIPAENHYFTVGAELWQRSLTSGRETNNAGVPILEEVPLPNSSFTSGGVYAQDEWKIVPQYTTLVLGARYDAIRVHNDVTYDTVWVVKNGIKTYPNHNNQAPLWKETTSNTKSWSINTGVQQVITQWLDGSAMFSTAFRTPELEELYQMLNNNPQLYYVGNPNLQPEKNQSVDGGFRFHLPNIILNVDAYYNSYHDLVGDTAGFFEGTPARLKTNIGEARIYGYEVSLTVEPVSSLKVRATLDYVRGEDTKNHANLLGIIPLHGGLNADYWVTSIGTAHLGIDAFADKTNPGNNELSTAGYATMDAGFVSVPLPIANTYANVSLGAQNIFNRSYTNFLSTLRGNYNYEPGRNFYFVASYHF